jgi:hypothetical protein
MGWMAYKYGILIIRGARWNEKTTMRCSTEREQHDALSIGRIQGAPSLISFIVVAVSNQRVSVCNFGVFVHHSFFICE